MGASMILGWGLFRIPDSGNRAGTRQMTKCYWWLRLIDFYLIYVNILVVSCSFPLKVSICVRKGSETAKKHDIFIFRPKIMIFGLSAFS